MEQQISVAL